MDSIYKSARAVISWIGSIGAEDESIHLAIDSLNLIAKELQLQGDNRDRVS
jgi:hypothetical protein